MVRFLLRLLSTIALAIGIVMAVLDATRSVASSALVTTPLATSWAAVSPDTLEQTRLFVVESLHPVLWNPVLAAVLALPGFVVFACISIILFAFGRRPIRRQGDFALEN